MSDLEFQVDRLAQWVRRLAVCLLLLALACGVALLTAWHSHWLANDILHDGRRSRCIVP
jgi:hypothetical protein